MAMVANCSANGGDLAGITLNVGFEAIWLTDYHAGTVSRLPVKEALHRCDSTRFPYARR